MKISKLIYAIGLGSMIILYTGNCAAFPLPTADIKRIYSSVKIAMTQAQQLKQEIDSNIKIIKEIQNGGYAAAAGDLFAKVQNGDYDRFGNNVKGLKDSAYGATHSAQSVEEKKKKDEEKRLAKENKMLEKQKKAKEKGDEAAEDAHEEANESFGKRAYNWIKSNRLATDSALNSLNGATSGNWGSAIENLGISSGAIVGGNDGAGISSLGGIVSSGFDIVNGSDNLGDAVVNTFTNGKLSSSLDNMDRAGQAKQDAYNAAEKAVEEKQHNEIIEGLENVQVPDNTLNLPPVPNVDSGGEANPESK